MSDLIEQDKQKFIDELLALGVVTQAEIDAHTFHDNRMFIHAGPIGGRPGNRMLVVQITVETYDLEDAFMRTLGIRQVAARLGVGQGRPAGPSQRPEEARPAALSR